MRVTAFRAVEAARPLHNGAAMWRLLPLALLLVVGCAEPTKVIDRHVEGRYHVGYSPRDGQAIDFERTQMVFEDPELVPQCCLGVYRRTATTLELAVGNWVDSEGAVMQARLYVDGVGEGAQTVGLDAARVFVWYDAGAEGKHFVEPDPSTQVGGGLRVTGQLKLTSLHCIDEPDGPDGTGCALQAEGQWAFESIDGVVRSSGAFLTADSVGQLAI
jgi:hypothetical protein